MNKQKSNKDTSSNVEVMLNVMMEEENNYTVTRMKFLERGCVKCLKQENKHFCVQEEKIQLAKIKEEREKK